MNDEEVVCCPHCNGFIIIEKLNCGIFRHGTYKDDGKQIDPHLCKEECEDVVSHFKSSWLTARWKY
jgi:hypothetical protein